MKTKIVSVTNSKGGVGKTTTTVMLARLLARKYSKKILIISLDRQRNIDGTFGYDDEKFNNNIHSTFELLTTDININDCILHTNEKNIDIILASYKLNEVDKILYRSNDNYQYILKEKIDTINSDYDYIFLDSGPKFDIITENALSAATNVLIPINPKLYSFEVLELLLTDVMRVKNNFNDNLKINGVFLNQIKHTKKDMELHNHLIRILKNNMMRTYISDRKNIQYNTENEFDIFKSNSQLSNFVTDQYDNLLKECKLYE